MRHYIFLLILFIISIILVSCSPSAERSSCCQQCLDAASRDPAGYDIFIKECSRYELSQECTQYFEKNEVSVGECREVEKEAEKLKK